MGNFEDPKVGIFLLTLTPYLVVEDITKKWTGAIRS